MGNFFLGLIVSLAVLSILLLIFREVVCWYWKLNHIVSLLQSINSKLGGKDEYDSEKAEGQLDKELTTLNDQVNKVTKPESKQDDSIPSFMDRR